MENPFPGMDPWMEGDWCNARFSLLQYIADGIRASLPADLIARVEEREFRKRGWYVAYRNIEIRERRPSRRAVTIVEVLDPLHKSDGPASDAYRRSRRVCIEEEINLVEIDLLRGGNWMIGVPANQVPKSALAAGYRVCINRAAHSNQFELYPMPLRSRLPIIPIPLRPGDRDVTLDLQSIINRVYVTASFDDTDYEVDPIPPLSDDDAAWADGILRAKGLRGM